MEKHLKTKTGGKQSAYNLSNDCPKLSCGKTTVELHTPDLIAVICVSVSAKLSMVYGRTENCIISLSSGESLCGEA